MLAAASVLVPPEAASAAAPYGTTWRITGHEARLALGVRVAPGGDVDGDGMPDLLVSATASVTAPLSGSVYVVFGRRGASNTSIVGTRGFRIDGAAAHDAAVVAAPAGDVNRDGLDDVLVGAPKADVGGAETGAAYVVFGKRSDTPVTLGSAGPWGYRISGALPGDQAGTSVAPAGDVNGDDVPDQLVGAPEASDLGRAQSGSVYVVHGRRTPAEVRLALVGVDPTLGRRIVGGSAGDGFGYAVAAVPDVDADADPEVLVGAPFAAPSGRQGAGAAYVIAGATTLPLVDVAAPGAEVLTIAGATTQGGLGYAVDAAPTVAAGGRPGLALGEPGLLRQATGVATTAGDAGSVHVVAADSTSGSLDLAQPPATALRIAGATAGQRLGEAVAVVSDSNRDGIADLLLGGTGPEAPPAAYLVYGGRPGTIRLDRAFAGVRVAGPPRVAFGAAVAAVGDLDGDRRPELVVGAPRATVTGLPVAGAVHVVFSAATPAATSPTPRATAQPPRERRLPASGPNGWPAFAPLAATAAALIRLASRSRPASPDSPAA